MNEHLNSDGTLDTDELLRAASSSSFYLDHRDVKNFTDLLYSIEWTESWMIGLISFHVIILASIIVFRHRYYFQGVLFSCLTLLVYFSENLNEIAAMNWNLFTKYQYFDQGGMFISAVFSTPVLVNALVIIVNLYVAIFNTMVGLQRKKVQRNSGDPPKEETKKSQ